MKQSINPKALKHFEKRAGLDCSLCSVVGSSVECRVCSQVFHLGCFHKHVCTPLMTGVRKEWKWL